MKKALLFVALTIACAGLTVAQLPQGLHYQSVARNNNGSLLNDTPLTVRFGIRAGSGSGLLLYEEEHSLTTNQLGLFTAVIGSGSRTGGSHAAFADIDWTAGVLYLQVQINTGSGFTDMGASPLMAVPYALSAAEAGAIDAGKLIISGDQSQNDEEALFEVKRNDGQPVFAVYPDGVRIWVEEEAKGSKGGFAVGGFNPSKKITNEYLRITPDSVRIYIEEEPGKGSKGGFAVGGFNPNKALTTSYLKISADLAAAIINPSEPRLLWYPRREAFRAGRVLIEHPDSVGLNSTATGYESKASGDYSQSFGYRTNAKGDYSTAIGKDSRAFGENSYAFGSLSRTLGPDAFAFGSGAIAEAAQSFAFGSIGVDTMGNVTGNPTKALGEYSLAMGMGSVTEGRGAVALGSSTTATGDYSLALGTYSRAEGYKSVAINATASGSNSFAAGYLTRATGSFSTAMGGGYFRFGLPPLFQAKTFYNEATGSYSTALGKANLASGLGATAIGNYAWATGNYSASIGYGTYARSLGSFVVGRYNEVAGDSLTWVTSDPLLVVGNGAGSTSRNNALTILKNGNVGIGTSNPKSTLAVNGTVTASAYSTSSDASFKENIREIENPLEVIGSLRGVGFDFRQEEYPGYRFPEGRHYGVIAQELETVLPDMVQTNGKGEKSVTYDELIPILLEALKEQQQQIKALQTEVERLKETQKK